MIYTGTEKADSLKAEEIFSPSTPNERVEMDGLGGDDRLIGAAFTRNYIHGGTGNDTIEGSFYADQLFGDDGNDRLMSQNGPNQRSYLHGGAGNDTVTGGSGGSLLNGGAGADQMQGLEGADCYIVDSVRDRIVEFDHPHSALDEVRSSVSWTLGANLERLKLTGTEDINGTGNSLSNLISGNAGANVLKGGWGADTMLGGAGNDTYVVQSASDRVHETTVAGGSIDSGGRDTVKASVSYSLGAYVENLTLAGPSAIDGTGNTLANRIHGNAQSNDLQGKGGNDFLSGGGGHDLLRGGTGSDVLDGGAGFDRFRFDAPLTAGNVDRVVDFMSSDDVFQLDDAAFAGIGAVGAMQVDAFRRGAAALDASDRIVYDASTGELMFDADGTGALTAVVFATVTVGAQVTATDFLIV